MLAPNLGRCDVEDSLSHRHPGLPNSLCSEIQLLEKPNVYPACGCPGAGSDGFGAERMNGGAWTSQSWVLNNSCRSGGRAWGELSIGDRILYELPRFRFSCESNVAELELN